MTSVFQHAQKSTSSSRLGRSTANSLVFENLKKPALALVFLMAIMASYLVVKQTQPLQSQAVDASQQTSASSEAGGVSTAPETITGTDEQPTPAGSNVRTDSSLSTQTTIENGKAKVELQVNGQTVPVPQYGSTSQTFTNSNGSITNLDISVQNNQTNSATSSIGTNSSSFSTSFQSLTISGNH